MRWLQLLFLIFNVGASTFMLVQVVMCKSPINYQTFLWILIYFVLSSALVHLYMLYASNRIDDWYDVESIDSIKKLSIFSTVICLIVILTYLGLEYHQTNSIELKNGILTPLVPLVACFLCSLILFMSSLKFRKYVILCKPIDVQPTRRNYEYGTNND